VPFSVSQRTLQQLDWQAVVARLLAHAATPRGRARLASDGDGDDAEAGTAIFAASDREARERMAETGEARALLDLGDAPPLGGVSDQASALRRLAAGGVLAARELLELGHALATLRDTRRFLHARRETAPGLASRADTIEDQPALLEEIEWCLDPEGEVRDAASPALAEARSLSHSLGSELQRRLTRYLHDPDIAECLSDSFVTVRSDRYVLPVRADARGRVRGIVHDASGSGTTLFIEPEAVVETNNRLKQAELEVERETLRVLRRLSEQAAAGLPALDAGLEALATIDLAFARGRLSVEMDACEPEIGNEGVFVLPQLRHPLLEPANVVPNDLRLGEGAHVLVISGPNAGGKTVAMKALALAALFARAGLHVPADPGARVDQVDAVLADIGDAQSLRESLSTFSAHMANLARIVERAGPHSLVVLDELGVGTDPGEGAALAQSALEALADAGARVVATTHYNLLKEMADVDARFENACVEFEPETLAPTYRLRLGAAGASSATAVAARMGLRGDVIERANALLEREDRRLDKLLSELSASRAALERERSEAERLRAEGEDVRARYRSKLERLQQRRDELFREMRGGLDRAFQDAHGEVAAVIRQLQRGGTSAQEAARARERLLRLQERQRASEDTVAPSAEGQAELPAVDWRFAKPGDPVRVVGGGEGALLALPDKRGRVAVRVGGARVVVPADRVAPAREAAEPPARRPPPRVRIETRPTEPTAGHGTSERVDFHGLRVDDALERLPLVLDRAARAGCDRVVIVHGRGTGALREAVREWLRECPYVERYEGGDPEEGGEGATVAHLA
jgi:DNA mismatch repair protein MutS2